MFRFCKGLKQLAWKTRQLEMSLKNDSRAIPAVTKVMSQYGLDALAPDPPKYPQNYSSHFTKKYFNLGFRASN